MKLSEKGLRKILRTCKFDEDRSTYVLKHSEAIEDYYFEIEESNFESNDFEDCVMLTVKEVKEILQSSYDVFSYSECPCIHQDNALKVQALLKGKIEEAESKSLILKE